MAYLNTPASAPNILLSLYKDPLPPFTTLLNVRSGSVTYNYWVKITNDITVPGLHEGDPPVPTDAVCVCWSYGDVVPENATSYNPQSDVSDNADNSGSRNAGTSYPNRPIIISIKAGEAVYVSCQVIRPASTPANLHIKIVVNPVIPFLVTSPPFDTTGKLFIPPASVFLPYYTFHKGHSGGFIDPVVAEWIVNFIPFFQSSEQGDILSDGTMAYVDNSGVCLDPPETLTNQNIGFYDRNFQFQFLDSFPRALSHGLLRTNIITDRFCFVNIGGGGTFAHFYILDRNGSLIDHQQLSDVIDGTTVGFSNGSAAATNPNETSLYIAGIGPSGGAVFGNIMKWSIHAVSIPPASSMRQNFISALTGYRVNDILIMPDGLIVALYQLTVSPRSLIIRTYTDNVTTGLLINSFSQTLPVEQNGTYARLGYAVDRAYVWLLIQQINGYSRIRKVRVSDGFLAKDFAVPNELNLEVDRLDPPMIYVSDTCPIIEMTAGTIPPETADLIINKVVLGGPDGFSFHFSTTGGLVPNNFNLEDGESRSFPGISPGTYGVTEDPYSDYDTTYEVSNGNAHDSITLAAGDVVTVTVTNNYNVVPTPAPVAGIYKIVPKSAKPEDTLYDEDGGTFEVKIPDPTWKTGAMGE